MPEMVSAVNQAVIETLLRHWRWHAEEGKGGMDYYIRVRDAAQKAGFERAASELERTGREASQERLLALAASFRRASMQGEAPQDLPVPPFRARPNAPEADQQKLRREQQLGYRLAMAACSTHLQEAAGGEM